MIRNLEQARYECTFGRGCQGVCCRNGRPPVLPEEHARIEAALPALLPRLRPEAAAAVREGGVASRRHAGGNPMLRVAAGWCVMFNAGCVLHATPAKPLACALFPVARHREGGWKIRQRGYDGEIWDLWCLDPAASTVPAAASLGPEIALAAEISLESLEDVTPPPPPRTTPR